MGFGRSGLWALSRLVLAMRNIVKNSQYPTSLDEHSMGWVGVERIYLHSRMFAMNSNGPSSTGFIFRGKCAYDIRPKVLFGK